MRTERSEIALWVVLFLLTFVVWKTTFTDIQTLGAFIDEIINTDAAMSFAAKFSYTSHLIPNPFDARISSGFLSTLPAAIGFGVGGNIFWARFTTAFTVWFLTLLLGYAYFRKFFVSPALTLIVATFVWMFMRWLPYGQGYIQNLAETQGALWLAFGFLALDEIPEIGGFLLGIAVWQCKFIYLPMATALFVYRAVTKKRVVGAVGFFIIPLVTWLFIILIKLGFGGLGSYLKDFVHFVIGVNSGAEAPSHGLSFLERLRSPTLEWAGYSGIWKFKIFVVLLGATAVSIQWLRGPIDMLDEKLMQRKTRGLFCLGLILFYSFWYFRLHPYMWIRHLLPALYMCEGIMLYAFFEAFRVSPFLDLVNGWMRGPAPTKMFAEVQPSTVLRDMAAVAVTAIPMAAAIVLIGDFKTSYAFQCHGDITSEICKETPEAKAAKLASAVAAQATPAPMPSPTPEPKSKKSRSGHRHHH